MNAAPYPRQKTSCFLSLLAATLLIPPLDAENVILFIGDGMGNEHVKAARGYNGAPLSFEALPYQAQVTTHSANNSVTDSAASGTAIATGVKVNNYVVSLALPGDGSELETSLELHQKLGRKTGLVTTTYLTHATPATFGAHETDRNNYSEIGLDYLNRSRPNVLFGGGGNGLTPASTIAAGYSVATEGSGFDALNPATEYLSAQFGVTYMPYEADYLTATYPYPHLSDMVGKALEALQSDPDGFFLMVEGGMIDQACHSNQLERSVHETLELSRAVQVALDWAASRDDTLILVTADHETGGLKVTQDNGTGAYPTVTWSTTGHTGVTVPAYAWGLDAERVTGLLDNTDIHRICTGKPMPTVNFIPAGSPWKFDATGNDLGSVWRESAFDDSNWASGPAKLGYGDGNEATVLPASPVRSCYYFRHSFEVDHPAAYADLSLEILRDDGAVVYLNGTEVARYNMPAGDITYGTWAATATDYTWDPARIIPNLLVAGTNVLAVEVHQGNSTSSDLALDLSLKAQRLSSTPNPPVLTAVPGDGSVALSWTASQDPEGDSVSYLVFRRLATGTYSSPLTAEMMATTYLDTSVENGTQYGYLVRAMDPAGNLSDSAEVLATPEAPVPPDYTAYVGQDPAGTYAALSGSHLSLAPGAAGAQTLTELKTGTGARLDAEYLLQTIARPFEVTSVTLHLSGTYADTNDPLVISLWTGSAWSDITAAMANPSYAAPLGCVDANGQIRVRFTDSVNARKETVGKLTLDELFAVVTVGEPPPNQPPVAQNDTAITSADTSVTVDLLANDSDPDGDALAVIEVSQPANGTVSLDGRNATYLPAGGFVGSDSFTYTVSDNRGGTAGATVFLTVDPAGTATVGVAGIDLTATSAGKNWKATAAVMIVDQTGAPAAGATVTGEWLFNGSPLASGTTAVTDAAGAAYLTSPTVRTSGGTFTFRVINVALAGATCTHTGDAVSVQVP